MLLSILFPLNLFQNGIEVLVRLSTVHSMFHAYEGVIFRTIKRTYRIVSHIVLLSAFRILDHVQMKKNCMQMGNLSMSMHVTLTKSSDSFFTLPSKSDLRARYVSLRRPLSLYLSLFPFGCIYTEIYVLIIF